MFQLSAICERIAPTLTREENDRLDRTSPATLLASVLIRYEEKAQKYLNHASVGIRSSLPQESDSPQLVHSKALEQALEYGYASLSEPRISFLSGLCHVLKRHDRALLVSIGCSTYYQEGETTRYLDSLATKVFCNYIARQRLFNLLGREELFCWVRHVSVLTNAPSLFSEGLVESFFVETQVRNMQQQREAVFAACTAILHHIGSVLKSYPIEEEDQNEFFAHLQTAEEQLRFSQVLARIYLQSSQEEIARDHRAICDSSIQGFCRPCLRFLGVSLSVQARDIERERALLEQEQKSRADRLAEQKEGIAHIEREQQRQVREGAKAEEERIRSAAATAIASAHAQIDQSKPRVDAGWSIGIGYTARF